LGAAPNSAGFLIRHIADVELLFAKNVFKAENIPVHAKTVIAQTDTGNGSIYRSYFLISKQHSRLWEKR
jgi:hypothetical protein